MADSWLVTNLDKPHALAAKLRKRGTECKVRGRDMYVTRADGRKPWAELAGHMTNATQVEPYTESE